MSRGVASERMRSEGALALGMIMGAVIVAIIVILGATTKPAEAAFPGANGKIAFVSDRTIGTGVDNPTGDFEIFVMNRDRTRVRQLTFNTAHDSGPVFSADGGRIAFTSDRDGNGEVYVMNADGTGQTRLTTHAASDGSPAFFPDATKIAFVSYRDGNAEIYVMDTADSNSDGNGDNPTNLTNNTAVDDYSPAVSPDGSKIAFTRADQGNFRTAEIYVMDADGSNPLNFTDQWPSDSLPTWSPDGTRIAFVSDRSDARGDIYVMNAAGSEEKRITKHWQFDTGPAFSPDGQKLVFSSWRGRDCCSNDIFTMKARPESRENRPRNLTKNVNVEDFSPDWQPIP